MKKVLSTLCLVALMLSGTFAQKVVFPTDADGNIAYTNEFASSKSKADLFENANLWPVTTFHSKDAVFSSSEEKGEVLANGTVKSKSSYNPFAGWFYEYVTFIVKFNVSDGKIAYTIYKPTLTETYTGYSTNQKITSLDEIYENYRKAYENIESAKNDDTMSKKDKKKIIKESEEIIEECEESLEEAQKSLRELANMIEKNLFK